jgi:hypothetical protein
MCCGPLTACQCTKTSIETVIKVHHLKSVHCSFQTPPGMHSNLHSIFDLWDIPTIGIISAVRQANDQRQMAFANDSRRRAADGQFFDNWLLSFQNKFAWPYLGMEWSCGSLDASDRRSEGSETEEDCEAAVGLAVTTNEFLEDMDSSCTPDSALFQQHGFTLPRVAAVQEPQLNRAMFRLRATCTTWASSSRPSASARTRSSVHGRAAIQQLADWLDPLMRFDGPGVAMATCRRIANVMALQHLSVYLMMMSWRLFLGGKGIVWGSRGDDCS